MRPSLFILLLCFAHLTCFSQITRKALFLGNSYTYYNNMPQLLVTMADGVGDSLIFDSNTPGGYTLDDHANDPTSQAKLMAGGWDYVVLQEQSQLPAFQYYNSQGTWNLADWTKKYSPCGRLMFYMTWGRQNGDALNCATWPPVCTYIGMDTLLRRRYMEAASDYGGELSPVGAAWRHVRQNYPSINLYDPDQSHPSFAGSYLAACCFYAAIFKKDPTQITNNFSLNATIAGQLRQAAKLVVFDSLPDWNFVPLMPTADFDYLIGNGNNEVIFTNKSLLADSYLWDFGDGTNSTLKNPSHNYAANGTYTIALTAYNCDLDTTYLDIHQMTVTFCAHTPTITPTNLTLCPNATDTLRTQAFSSYQWYQLVGTGVSTSSMISGANNQYFLPTGGNTYYVIAEQNGCKETSAPVDVYLYSHFSSYMVTAYGNLLAEDTACIGESITLVLAPTKPPFLDNDALIDWSLNGQPISGYHNDTLIITAPGVYGVTLHHEVCPNYDRYNNQQLNYVFVPCITGLKEQLGDWSVSVYPNPNNGTFNVEAPENASLTIQNIIGQTILTEIVASSKARLSVPDLSSGVYFIHVRFNGKQKVIRMIKE